MEANINFVGDFSRINDEERGFINKRLEKFKERHEQDFREMLIHLDMHLHSETSRGRPAYYSKLTVHTDRGKFHAEHQDFGGEKSLYGALDKVERQIEKHLAPKPKAPVFE